MLASSTRYMIRLEEKVNQQLVPTSYAGATQRGLVGRTMPALRTAAPWLSQHIGGIRHLQKYAFTRLSGSLRNWLGLAHSSKFRRCALASFL
jgi:hypothetical protein